MQTKNYTVFNFDFQTLKIPNDRPDLIESANNLIEFAKIEVDTLKVKKIYDNRLIRFNSFVGTVNGSTTDEEINEFKVKKYEK